MGSGDEIRAMLAMVREMNARLDVVEQDLLGVEPVEWLARPRRRTVNLRPLPAGHLAEVVPFPAS